MIKQSKSPVPKINTLRESWRTQEPNRSFYGHTLPQFEAAVAEVFAVREEGADLAKRVKANAARRKDVDEAALALIRNIVHAVKADPEVGEDSLLYAAMGYIRKADRGGGRRRVRLPVGAPPEGDSKPIEQKA
jgi:hypothetical protein